MLEPIILFALGGAGYQAIELAWRGTTHWTMFAAGGACLCLLQQLARRRSLPLGAAALCGAAAASGVELGVGLACRYLLHLAVWDYSALWGNVAGLVCPLYSFYWFLLCFGCCWCCAGPKIGLKDRFIVSQNGLPSLKVQIMVLAILYNGSITKLNQTGKAVHIMTQQFRYVAGHIEVYSEYGEFLFSADTMQEAWEELSA